MACNIQSNSKKEDKKGRKSDSEDDGKFLQFIDIAMLCSNNLWQCIMAMLFGMKDDIKMITF